MSALNLGLDSGGLDFTPFWGIVGANADQPRPRSSPSMLSWLIGVTGMVSSMLVLMTSSPSSPGQDVVAEGSASNFWAVCGATLSGMWLFWCVLFRLASRYTRDE